MQSSTGDHTFSTGGHTFSTDIMQVLDVMYMREDAYVFSGQLIQQYSGTIKDTLGWVHCQNAVGRGNTNKKTRN